MNEFMMNPTRIDRPRSVFPIHFREPTTMRVGEITPLMVKEILPGDTFSIDLSSVVIANSPFVSRVFGDLFLDVYAFFVPNRLVWTHWEQFCGQNDDGAWTQNKSYKVPKGSYTFGEGNNGDFAFWNVIGAYMTGCYNKVKQDDDAVKDINELPLRGYARIYNEWFRNENTDTPIPVTYGDSANTGITYDHNLLIADKFPDYFVQCLPQPQKGGAVTVPLGTTAPLVASHLSKITSQSGANNLTLVPDVSSSSGYFQLNGANSAGEINGSVSGLMVDLSAATSATINQWRIAFQTQKYLETMARGGSRYIESLKSLFNVTNGDARLQRSEYLGGKRIPLRFQEVVANSSSAANSDTKYALGQQVMKLSSADVSSLFTKSFTEHGFLHVYGVVRVKNQYCQGFERQWTREDFLDYYNPVFDSIGETPVYNQEIYATGGEKDLEVFGYQEAWADYRYMPDRVTGALNPCGQSGLTTFTFAEKFIALPTLNGIMKETRTKFTRTLALSDSNVDFICDFYFFGKMARPMSLRSIPGLIDHF